MLRQQPSSVATARRHKDEDERLTMNSNVSICDASSTTSRSTGRYLKTPVSYSAVFESIDSVQSTTFVVPR